MSTVEDRIKYLAAKLRATSEWTLAAMSDVESIDTETGLLSDDIRALVIAVSALPNPKHYSDGREVRTAVWIVENEMSTEHVWNPDGEEPSTWSSWLPTHDPEVKPTARYTVTTEPATQQIHIRILRSAA